MRYAIKVVLAVGAMLTLGRLRTAIRNAPSRHVDTDDDGDAFPDSKHDDDHPTLGDGALLDRWRGARLGSFTFLVANGQGTTKVTRRGVRGVRSLTYEVTLTNGEQTGKRLVRNAVTKAPVTRVIAVGTRTTRQCDPNYSGACVPIASDVDCAGGSGNGPAYLQGTARVVGTDIYDLDRDGDGIACDD
jgi:hypothetical protein